MRNLEKHREKTTDKTFPFVVLYTTILFIVLVSEGLTSCSPVRSNVLNKKDRGTTSNKGRKTSAIQEERGVAQDSMPSPQVKTTSKNNFVRFTGDTVVVKHEPVTNVNPIFESAGEFDFTPEFQKAVLEFDVNFIEKACNKFDFFVSTLNPEDTLYFEAMFYKSECLITNTDYKEAEKILTRVINSKKVPEAVLQKSVVRLGHLYCAMGKTSLAEKTFTTFKEKFPKSKLVRLANCSVVQKWKK